MIPIAWAEPEALTTRASDPMGSLRQAWRVVFRCPACNILTCDVGPTYLVAPGGAPAPIGPAHAAILAALAAEHRCPEAHRA